MLLEEGITQQTKGSSSLRICFGCCLKGVDGFFIFFLLYIKDAFVDLTTLYGGIDVIDKAEALAGKVEGLEESLRNLKAVSEGLKSKGYESFITVDLGEIRGFDYYTGIIFEGFAAKSGKALLSGGRYDNLMGKYGCVCSATGFAFDMSAVASALATSK